MAGLLKLKKQSGYRFLYAKPGPGIGNSSDPVGPRALILVEPGKTKKGTPSGGIGAPLGPPSENLESPDRKRVPHFLTCKLAWEGVTPPFGRPLSYTQVLYQFGTGIKN